MSTIPPIPPARYEDGLDVSYRDVPYPVVPAFTDLPLAHLAVECEGVYWHRGSSSRIIARTKCGRRGVTADRNNSSWSRPCKSCFPTARQRAAEKPQP